MILVESSYVAVIPAPSASMPAITASATKQQQRVLDEILPEVVSKGAAEGVFVWHGAPGLAQEGNHAAHLAAGCAQQQWPRGPVPRTWVLTYAVGVPRRPTRPDGAPERRINRLELPLCRRCHGPSVMVHDRTVDALIARIVAARG